MIELRLGDGLRIGGRRERLRLGERDRLRDRVLRKGK